MDTKPIPEINLTTLKHIISPPVALSFVYSIDSVACYPNTGSGRVPKVQV